METIPDANDNPSTNQGSRPSPRGERRGPMVQLSDEERAQIKAAHDKAIEEDPSLKETMQAAREAVETARKAMNEAMVKADPSVEALLAKIMPRKKDWNKEGDQNQAGGGEKGDREGRHPRKHDVLRGKGMASLTESERQQVKAVHEQVKNDPAVTSAREAMKSAGTPKAREAARETLHQATHEAMLKADPSIEPLLKKLNPKAAEMSEGSSVDQ